MSEDAHSKAKAAWNTIVDGAHGNEQLFMTELATFLGMCARSPSHEAHLAAKLIRFRLIARAKMPLMVKWQ